MQLQNVGFGYKTAGSKTLFSNAEMSVDSKSRIVLLGENGNGKTTLVKLMTGALEPSEGEVKRNAQCRIAIVNQHHADQIDLQMTPHEFMRSKFPGDGSNAHDLVLRSHLDRMGAGDGEDHREVVRGEIPKRVVLGVKLAETEPVRVDVAHAAELARVDQRL